MTHERHLEDIVGRKAVGRRIKWLRHNALQPTDKKMTVDDICCFVGMGRSSYFAVERGSKALTFEQAYLFSCLYSIEMHKLLSDF